MPSPFSCITCREKFERSRPSANREKFCSLLCRWRYYCGVPEDPDACWPWQGTLAKSGYGVLRLEKKTITAHRVAFFLTRGRWPTKHVLHSCDNRPCCNPSHLYEGTDADNSRDAWERKRHAWFRWTEEEKSAWLTKILSGQKLSRLRVALHNGSKV